MATLAAIQKQIADLEKQAESLRKAEALVAAAKVKELIARHQLSAQDLGFAPVAKAAVSAKPSGAKGAVSKPITKTATKTSAKSKPAAAPKPAGIPKYQDPKTGKTWTGNGQAPGWIAGAKSRDAFLIGNAGVAVKAAAPVPAAPAKKAAVKAAAVVAPAAPAAPAKKAVAKAAAAPAKKSGAPAKKAVERTAASKTPVAPAVEAVVAEATKPVV